MNTAWLIPVYRHLDTLPQVLRALEPYGLPVIVVDDGNEKAINLPGTEVVTLPTNCGKGFALRGGLLRAQELGYSHVIQLDADGQHDIHDAFELLALAQATPNALITAKPLYDHTAPLHRLKARWLTHLFIRLECGLAQEDGMCGCRIYPVNQACSILPRVKSKRMGFDIEFIVHWMWAGYPLRQGVVHVTYPTNGFSNFKLLRDNLAFIAMHTRLCLRRLTGFYRRERIQ